MIVKIELLIDVPDKFIALYQGDPRNMPQIILDEIKSDLEFDGYLKIILAEANG